MPPVLLHLPFLEDALGEFESAWNVYRILVGQSASDRKPSNVARLVRSLYLALEKLLKHEIAKVDPYLLIQKPNQDLLLTLRKDLVAQPAPSIFCSRQRFDTPSLTDAWTIAKELFNITTDQSTLADFERAQSQLAELRHRSQHAELYVDADEILLVTEQLLARLRPTLGKVAGDFFAGLYERNNQLDSALKGIERQVDSSYQVVLDYLSRPSPVAILTNVWLTQETGSDRVSIIMGKSGFSFENDLRFVADVPTEDAKGLFRLTLHKELAKSRLFVRALAEQVRTPMPVQALPELGLLGSLQIPVPPPQPLAPLDPGQLLVRRATGWLSLSLRELKPPYVSVGVLVQDLSFEFAIAEVATGIVTGVLRSASTRGSGSEESIPISGTCQLTSEFVMDPDPARERNPGETTVRNLDVSLTLTTASVR
jgi:hypothetical protein